MRTLLALAATALLTAPLAGQQRMDDPDNKVAGGGTLPAGWSARLDRAAASLADVKFTPMGKGFHATTGPAAILWRATDRATGPVHTVATFTQTKAPTHPEGYGLFIAGKDLSGDGQAYTYFLVRGDGKYLIKQRTGATTSNVTEGWLESSAVAQQDAEGKCTNKLEILVGKDKITFSANGKEVYSMAPPAGGAAGIIGLRVNHNLDVHVEGFGVHGG